MNPAVLKYWSEIEAFNIPDVPTGKPLIASAEDAQQKKQTPAIRSFSYLFSDPASCRAPLPWTYCINYQEKGHEYVWRHTVYLGVSRKQSICDALLLAAAQNGVGCGLKEEMIDPLPGNGWLASVTVDHMGHPLSESYVCASFVLAAALLREQNSLAEIGRNIEEAQANFAGRVEYREEISREHSRANSGSMTWSDIDDENHEHHSIFYGAETWETMVSDPALIFIQSIATRKEYQDDPLPSFLNSFFLDDLISLSGIAKEFPEEIGPALSAYLTTPSVNQENARRDVLQNANAMLQCLPASRIPLGRWCASSKQPLSLAQQAAVFEISGPDSPALLSVNGPPGTGKTTLLKDVIANILVKKAIFLANLDAPHEIFEAVSSGHPRPTKHFPSGEYNLSFFKLSAAAAEGLGIVVTSSNNAAVENISLEIPCSVDRQEFPAASYFSAVADHLFTEMEKPKSSPPWGMVAAALGSKKNKSAFASAFMGFEPQSAAARAQEGLPTSIKPILDDCANNASHWRTEWEQSKKDFIALLLEVESDIVCLKKCDSAIDEIRNLSKWAVTLFDNESEALSACAYFMDQMLQFSNAISSLETDHSREISFLSKNKFDIDVFTENKKTAQKNKNDTTDRLKKFNALLSDIDNEYKKYKIYNDEYQNILSHPPKKIMWLSWLGVNSLFQRRWENCIRSIETKIGDTKIRASELYEQLRLVCGLHSSLSEMIFSHDGGKKQKEEGLVFFSSSISFLDSSLEDIDADRKSVV